MCLTLCNGVNMKRYITVQGNKQFTTENYEDFVYQCYNTWQIFPVSNVDLIIEYKVEIQETDRRILINTEDMWIYGVSDLLLTLDEMCDYAIVNLNLNCKNYIVAKIRNKKIVSMTVR